MRPQCVHLASLDVACSDCERVRIEFDDVDVDDVDVDDVDVADVDVADVDSKSRFDWLCERN